MDLIKRMPNWLRWLLTPVAVIAGFIIISLLSAGFAWIQSRMFGFGEDAWMDKIWSQAIAPAITGYCTIFIGFILAPSHKKIVALVFGILFIMLGGISALSVLGRHDWWGLIHIFSTIGGIGGAIYIAFENSSE